MCPAKVVEKFEFRGTGLKEISPRRIPTLVRLRIFLISTHFENLIHLALTVQKFGGPV